MGVEEALKDNVGGKAAGIIFFLARCKHGRNHQNREPQEI
jgi:hypothetical protein